MNVYKSYVERRRKAETDRIIEQHADEYIEHMDLCILMVLHDEFGFGAARLERFYRAIEPKFAEYKNRYTVKSDRTSFNGRDGDERNDTWVIFARSDSITTRSLRKYAKENENEKNQCINQRARQKTETCKYFGFTGKFAENG